MKHFLIPDPLLFVYHHGKWFDPTLQSLAGMRFMGDVGRMAIA